MSLPGRDSARHCERSEAISSFPPESVPRTTPTGRILAFCLIVLLIGTLTAGMAFGAGEEGGEDLEAKSRPYRTALHRAPTMGAPFERLFDLYSKADRVDELAEMYRGHLRSFPRDLNARIVLLRILETAGEPAALEETRRALENHPEHPYLHYLHYSILQSRHDLDALDALDRAIELEDRPPRRRGWIDTLLEEASAVGRRDLTEKHLRHLADMSAGDPARMLRAARRMIDHDFPAMALELLAKASEAGPSPETSVEIQMSAATAEVALGRAEAAARRLDALLEKLTPDYWRRPEIWRRRIALIDGKERREALCVELRNHLEKNPHDEAATLDLAQLLDAMNRRREALSVLLEAGKRLPGSAKIEEQILALYSRLQDARGRRDYLHRRLQARPDRNGLRLKYAKTLFLTGERETARRQLDELLERVGQDERADLLLGLARYLRRSLLSADAARIYERLLGLTPDRLHVRQELAETYIALGSRQKARRLLTRRLPERARIENLLDVVRFMISREMYRDARALLHGRLEKEPANLELRLLLLSIHRKLHLSEEGRDLVRSARELADTPPRYRRWLEGAAQFHESIERVRSFLEAEQARLRAEIEGSPDRPVDFALTYAEVANRHELRSQVTPLLEEALRRASDKSDRTEIRRKLVSILGSGLVTERGRIEDGTGLRRLQHHLEKLAEEAPESGSEVSARRALLQLRSGSEQDAVDLLGQVDFSRLRSAELLQRLSSTFRPRLTLEDRLEITRRLTEIAPSGTAHWERYLAALLAAGNEERLRATLGRIRAGVKKLSISEETRDLIRSHIIASYWRSVARRLAGGSQAQLADGLALANELDREVEGRRERLWTTWTRAYLLNRLGRKTARDAVVEELDRMARELTDGGGEEDGLFVAFPDGLSVAMDRARELLRAAPEETKPGAGHASPGGPGPTPPLRASWAFETSGRSPVLDIVSLGQERLLVRDQGSNLYCLARPTGKLLWEGEVSFLGISRAHMKAGSSGVPVPSAKILVDGEERIFLAGRGGVGCLSGRDGRVVWAADVAGVAEPLPGGVGSRLPTPIFLRGDTLLAYDPLTGVVSAFDAGTGKLRWESLPPREEGDGGREGQRLTWANSGADLSGDRLFVYGSRTAILDARTGRTIWHFDPERVREFPLELETARAAGSGPGSSSRPISIPRQSGRRTPPRQQGRAYYSYLQQMRQQASQVQQRQGLRQSHRRQSSGSHRGSRQHSVRRRVPVPPAIAWASPRTGHRAGMIRGDRLLLFSGGLLSLRLDIPLAARQFPVNGTVIGAIGERLCLLSGNTVTAVHARTGRGSPYDLGPISGEHPTCIRAGMRGALLYAAGPGGIICYNVGAGERVFHAPWPDSVAPDPSEFPPLRNVLPQAVLTARTDQQRNRGMLTLVPRMLVLEKQIVTPTVPGRIVALEEVPEGGSDE